MRTVIFIVGAGSVASNCALLNILGAGVVLATAVDTLTIRRRQGELQLLEQLQSCVIEHKRVMRTERRQFVPALDMKPQRPSRALNTGMHIRRMQRSSLARART